MVETAINPSLNSVLLPLSIAGPERGVDQHSS